MTGSQDWADQESFNAYVASLLQLLHSFQEYFRSCADGGCCEGGGGVGGVGGGCCSGGGGGCSGSGGVVVGGLVVFRFFVGVGVY